MERAMARPRRAPPPGGRRAARRGRLRAAGRPARPLGPRGARRIPGRSAAAHGRRRIRRRAAARATEVVAHHPGPRAHPHDRPRSSGGRRAPRSRVGRGRAHRLRRHGAPGEGAGGRRGGHGHRALRPSPLARRGYAGATLMGDSALYRRMLEQVRPYSLHFAALFGLGLMASPIALLTPLPIKIVVDSALGGRPLPRSLQGLTPHGASPTTILTAAIVLLLVVAVLGQVQNLSSTLLRAYVGERVTLDIRARLVAH